MTMWKNRIAPARMLPWTTASLLSLGCLACGGAPPPLSDTTKSVPVAKIDNAKPEGDLTTVTLSPEAEQHLAIETTKVSVSPVIRTRTVGGETIVPPGKSVLVSAPVAGTLTAGRATAIGPVGRGDPIFELLPLDQSNRDVTAEAERALQEATARLTQATQRAERLRQLLKEGSASQRSVEEAEADRAVAAAAAEAARKRLDSIGRLHLGPRGEMPLPAPFDGYVLSLRAAPGQVVSAGTAVAEIAQTTALWIRVPIYAGDLRSIDLTQPTLVAALGQEARGPWRQVRRVSGPPQADPAAATVDLYFELPGGGPFVVRPGERLAVRLPLTSTERALTVPQSAIVYDINGGTWVYERLAPQRYARRRVELAGPAGTDVIVSRGLSEGVTIVTVGAAELYGTEFYVSK
jgi:RND family efflux transporter MFP subunit